MEIFYTVKPAKVLIEQWCHHYNTIRFHSSLEFRPPAAETILPNVDGPTYAVDGPRSARQLDPRQTLLDRGPPSGACHGDAAAKATYADGRSSGRRRGV